MVTIISKMKVGEYSQPTAFQAEDREKKESVLFILKSRSEPHRMNLHDDYSKISQMALEEKKDRGPSKMARQQKSLPITLWC